MFLDINKIGEVEVPVEPDLDLAGLSDDAHRPLNPREVTLKANASRGVRGVDLRGRLTATVSLCCVRCLEVFDQTVSSEFGLTLVRDELDYPSGETELAFEDTMLVHCPEGRADLEAIGGEQLYLGLPLKPLCGPDCRGLCPTCGANRNRIECACRRDTVDPRLASLRALKDRMDKE